MTKTRARLKVETNPSASVETDTKNEKAKANETLPTQPRKRVLTKEKIKSKPKACIGASRRSKRVEGVDMFGKAIAYLVYSLLLGSRKAPRKTLPGVRTPRHSS